MTIFDWFWYGVMAFLALNLAYVFWYMRLRMRLHEKKLLHFRYDGHKHIDMNTKKRLTIFDLIKMEREYDRKQRIK